MKVERLTYPVMTPTGARGVLEAIFWKPEFSWRVGQIDILKPVRYLSLTRNEVTRRASERVEAIEIMGSRTQRHSLILREVAYVIHAAIVLRPHTTDDIAKYRDQFRRRVSRGACAHRPYLGCREFAAFFGPTDASEEPGGGEMDIGPMVRDNDYTETGLGSSFFDAQMINGRLRIPSEAG
jgi:CRISPR-associated protein Cas5d